LTEDLAILKPAIFPSVPRLWNRIYAKIKSNIDGMTGCKGWLAQTALATKLAATNATGVYTHGCYDALVFSKVKMILGGNVRACITASAPIDASVITTLKVAFCCPFLEGYGLTETSGGSSTTDANDHVTGHVGGPLGCVKWRFMDIPDMNYLSTDKPYPRGELCMKGPAVFDGYYKRPDKTAEAFDAEGWFKTGDIAMVYPNGSVKIIDRSKNIFKLSQGEYIAPEKIENIFGLSPFIAQTLIYGDSLRSCVVAIIVPHVDKA
jgi:long-chain acyl-CoA synthetase